MAADKHLKELHEHLRAMAAHADALCSRTSRPVDKRHYTKASKVARQRLAALETLMRIGENDGS